MKDVRFHPIFDTKITIFEGCFSSQVAGVITLRQWLFNCRNRELAEKYRALATDEERDVMKRQLPCATLNAVFEGFRRRDEPHTLTELMCVDIDAKDNPGFAPATLKQALSKTSFALYVGHSISGKGVFMVVKVKAATDEEFSRQYAAFRQMLIDDYGIYADKQCKDVTRLRTLSYDNKPFIRPDAATFYKAPEPKKKTVKRTYFNTHDQTNAKVYAAVELWEARGLMFDDHDTFVRLAASLKDVPNGYEMFERLCASYNKRHKIATRYQFEKAQSLKQITVGTFFDIMKDYGIDGKTIYELARFRFPDAFSDANKVYDHIQRKTPSEATKTPNMDIQPPPVPNIPEAASSPAIMPPMADDHEAELPPEWSRADDEPPAAINESFRYAPGPWKTEEAMFRADPANYPPGAPDDVTTEGFWQYLAECSADFGLYHC